MTLLTPLKKDKPAHAEPSVIRHPASCHKYPSPIPSPFKRTIIRPALLLFLLLSSTSTALADQFVCTVGGISYSVNTTNKTASVEHGYYIGDVVIPETITYNNTAYSVTSIGIGAFANSELTAINIPNSVSSIGRQAFFCCYGLTSLTIGNSVSSIGDEAFYYCSGLTSVAVDKNNDTYDSRDNCNAIIQTSTNRLVVGCKNTTIPNSVTTIGKDAFSGCSGLTSINIPNSVTSIGSGAFSNCSGLTSVTIPNSVTTIGEHAFHFCSGLTSVTIPNSVTSTSIGECAFYGCSGLTSVIIGNSVTSIGRNAFTKCDGLTSVIVDKYNSTYDSRDNCNAIIESSTNKLVVGCKNTTIPDSVTSIGNSAFEDCSELTSVTIPNSVTSIGASAFYGCDGLTSVVIGNSVTSIGECSFFDCSGLTKLVSLAVEPPICGYDALEYIDKSACRLFVPEESVNKYKVADQWEEFMHISEYDGVDDVSVDTQDTVYEVYNLQGVRVGSGMREAEITADALPHGIYILVSLQGRKKLKI